MRKKLSIILIRDRKVALSGCCCEEIKGGKVNNSDISILYKEIKANFDNNIKLDMVEATNFVYLVPRILLDGLRYKVSFKNAIYAVFNHRIPSVIVNGELLFNGQAPLIEEFKSKVESIV